MTPPVSQTDFTQAILSPDLPVPDGLVDPEGRPASKRFDVYRNNVVYSLTGALETAFPVIAKLLGPQFFTAMAGVYVRAHPPQSPLMMFYGAEMPAFLQSFEPVQKFGYLPDVARLELALRGAYHAEDATALDPTILQTLAPDALMASLPCLAPAARVITSPWPIYDLWHFNMTEGAPKPKMVAQDVLIVRPEFDPELVLLPVGAATFLKAITLGATFGDAVTAATSQTEDFNLAETLGLCLQHGVLTELRDPR